MDLKDIKDTKIFDDVSLEDLFRTIYEKSLEEREKALEVFHSFRKEIGDIEDIFMIGDKPVEYLDIAQKSTENLIKVVNAIQKIIEAEKDPENSHGNVNDIIDFLDKNNVGPERFIKNTSKNSVKNETISTS